MPKFAVLEAGSGSVVDPDWSGWPWQQFIHNESEWRSATTDFTSNSYRLFFSS
jgi:hypothetical protein